MKHANSTPKELTINAKKLLIATAFAMVAIGTPLAQAATDAPSGAAAYPPGPTAQAPTAFPPGPTIHGIIAVSPAAGARGSIIAV